ncbi:MAG: hypothetical protein IRY99_14570 [Isosphaeraceae bacterium]|nr:hypothetical protein [Isosphaeraceae bacterium]
MLRRLTAPLSLAAAALLLAACPAPSRASGLTTYKKVDFDLLAADTVLAPSTGGSPLTFDPQTSTGFDPSGLKLLLGKYQSPDPQDNQTYQAVRLRFNDGGLAPGGVLDFSLALNPKVLDASQPPFALSLLPNQTHLTLVQTEAPHRDAQGVVWASFRLTNAPEPLSALVWSSLAGLGLLRVRAYRRAHTPRG